MTSKWIFGIVGLVLGIAGTLFFMHFLIAANAYDPTSVYRLQAAGQEVNCLSFSTIQNVCNASREIVNMQAYVSYGEGYKAAEARCQD